MKLASRNQFHRLICNNYLPRRIGYLNKNIIYIISTEGVCNLRLNYYLSLRRRPVREENSSCGSVNIQRVDADRLCVAEGGQYNTAWICGRVIPKGERYRRTCVHTHFNLQCVASRKVM